MKAILAALLAAVPAQDASVKMGTLAPEGSPWHNILRDLSEDWKKATSARAQFRIFPGGVQGDEPDMVRKMRVGQLHAAALTGVGLSEIAPEIMALQMPMLIQSYEELDYVLEKMASRLERILESKGFKVLHWGDAGWVTFFGQKAIVTPDDLRAQKLFVWNSGTVEVAVWKDAGVQAVPLPATEIHTGLKSGLINAFSTTPLAALSFQWFGSARHMTDLKWAPLVGATVITTKRWNQLPESARSPLLEAARKAGERFKAETRKLGDDAVDVMKKHGLAVHAVPEDARAEWEKVARAAYPKIMGSSIPAAILDEVEKHRDDFRAARKGAK